MAIPVTTSTTAASMVELSLLPEPRSMLELAHEHDDALMVMDNDATTTAMTTATMTPRGPRRRQLSNLLNDGIRGELSHLQNQDDEETGGGFGGNNNVHTSSSDNEDTEISSAVGNNNNNNAEAANNGQSSNAPSREHTDWSPGSSSNNTATADDNDDDDRDTSYSLAKTEHLGKHRQYWRDILLGVNDGIISTFLLVAGVAGGGLDSRSILLTAIAGTVAGAVAMCAGEYVATKSQNEVLEGEIKLERIHVLHHRQEEMVELAELLEVVGIPKEETAVRQVLLQYYDQHPEAILKAMIALEFGVLEEEMRSPSIAGLTNFALFTWGALPSVIPFAFSENPDHGLIAAGVLTVGALLLVGAVKTWATRGNCATASLENLAIAVLGGGIAYGIGILFDHIIVK